LKILLFLAFQTHQQSWYNVFPNQVCIPVLMRTNNTLRVIIRRIDRTVVSHGEVEKLTYSKNEGTLDKQWRSLISIVMHSGKTY